MAIRRFVSVFFPRLESAISRKLRPRAGGILRAYSMPGIVDPAGHALTYGCHLQLHRKLLCLTLSARRYRSDRVAYTAAMISAGFPEFFQIIKCPGLGQHDVDDDVIQIHQHPFTFFGAFNTQGMWPLALALTTTFFGMD